MTNQPHRPKSIALVLVLLVAATAFGCGKKKESAADKPDGKLLFATTCARCHGPEGVPESTRAARLGVRDLTSPELQSSLSDDDLREQIRSGSPNGRMPAFASRLTADEIDAIVAYVRSLAAK